jgi:hypothetical protein
MKKVKVASKIKMSLFLPKVQILLSNIYLHSLPPSEEIYTHRSVRFVEMETNSLTYPARRISRNVFTSFLWSRMTPRMLPKQKEIR